MSPSWSRMLTRVGNLTWDEVRTRVQQEISKRLDVTLLRVDSTFGRVTTQEGATAKFFFTPQELPERIRLIQQHLPAEFAAILDDAKAICQHRFHLLGYTDLTYGTDIDWHSDVVHGKRAPLKPWFKIDFLNAAEVGDHKIIWELNRHQHLLTLAKAWLFTREKRYVDELIAQWYSWRHANPYPRGINWASSLEVAFRALAWIWVRQLLANCSSLTETFRNDLLQGLILHARHVERYLSTYFSPNTHLLGEALALFFVGVLCPEIPASQRWRDKGLQILVNEAGKQVRPDGVYFEQSLYYHVYALDMFLHARLLAQRNDIGVPQSFDEVLRRMLSVLKALAQNGHPDSFGDDDGGRLFNPRRNRPEHMTDPLALGALLYPDDQGSAAISEEAIWLFGSRSVDLPQSPAVNSIGRSHLFRDGGLFISFSGGERPEQLVFDAGPQGAMQHGHGHADALSIKISGGGRPYLTDRGTFSYMNPGPDRDWFRGTAAHNTVRVDDLDQAVPAGPFAWRDVATVQAEKWITGETFSFFSGSHNGYVRLNGSVVHRRQILHVYQKLFMVRDDVLGQGMHKLEVWWHLAPDLTISNDRNCLLATSNSNEGRLLMVPESDPEWRCDIQMERFSPVYGVAQPAQALRCQASLALPASHAMVLRVLLPEDQDHQDGELRRERSGVAQGATAYEYCERGCTHFMIFGERCRDSLPRRSRIPLFRQSHT